MNQNETTSEGLYDINLQEVLLGRPSRLRYVVRYSICPRTHDENVAEHSYYTAFIALMLVRSLWRNDFKINLGATLSRALMHDMDESYSGDFIRMFKHSSPELKEAIDGACNTFMQGWGKEVAVNGGDDLVRMWSDAKDDTVEGTIVSFADFLSVVSYVLQEIKAGNHAMYEHFEDLKKFYATFSGERYGFLQKYIRQCGVLLESVEQNKPR